MKPHSPIIGAFWGLLFSLPVWLVLVVFICHITVHSWVCC